jgi:GxxExxY protein
MNEKQYNKLTNAIIGAAIEVHRNMGPGLLESVYEECLMFELDERKINAKSQVKLPLEYKGKKLNKYFFIDIMVEDEVLIELKVVDEILPVHEVQLVTYLKLANKKLGLLINFHEAVLTHGIKRKINGIL